MSPIRVWAPDAQTVECVVAGDRHAMSAEEGGWWSWTAALVTVRSTTPSRSTPATPSRTHAAPGSRTGCTARPDLRRRRLRVDRRLEGRPRRRGCPGWGVSTSCTSARSRGRAPSTAAPRVSTTSSSSVWMSWRSCPSRPSVAPTAGATTGCSRTPSTSPTEARRPSSEFVDACHARGLAVCLDVVYNHVGPVGNYLQAFGPYFTDRHSTPWGPALNLDGPGSEEVRRWVIDNALRWFRDFHVDALRLDAVHALHDDSPRHILAELSDETAALSARLGRPLELIAESDLNDPVMVTPTAEGGRGMTAQWDDDVHHALHVALTRERQGYYADFAGGTEAWPEATPLRILAKTLTDGLLPRRADVDVPGKGLGELRSTRTPRPATGSSLTCRVTTRSATAPWATGSTRRSLPASRRSGPRSTCSRRTPPWCSWARSGGRARPSSSSPRSTTSGSLTRCAGDGARSSRRTGGPQRTSRPTGSRHAEASVLDWTELRDARAHRDARVLPGADQDPPTRAGRPLGGPARHRGGRR